MSPSLDALQEWIAALMARHQRHAGGGESVRDLSVAGHPLRLSFSSSGVEAAMYPALAHHPVSSQEPRFTILVSDGWEGMPPFPWRLEEVGARGEVAVATAGPVSTVWFGGSRALSVIDRSSRTAIFWTPSADELPWYERAAPLRTLFHWILSALDRSLVHAAAVAPHGAAAGALIAGAGGAGKSTTALNCFGSGFSYAGDDYVVLSRDDETTTVHSLYCSAKLTAASLERLSFLRPMVHLPPEGSEKGVVVLRDLDGPRRTSFAIRALIIPRVTSSSESVIRRSSSGAALRALAPTSLFQLPGSGSADLARMAGLIGGVAVWSIDLGSDFGRIPDLIRKAVEES